MKLASTIKTSSSAFHENQRFHQQQETQLNELLARIREGGGEAAQQAQKARGKLTARQRLAALIDEGSEFLELSALAGYQLYADELPAGGIITGIASINGRPCVVVANDQTVKGGTYYPITVTKHLRAQAIARQNQLPCLYLVDSGGAFLPMQDEVFPDKDDFGRIFYNQAQMSAAGIAQLSSVHGFCTAGGAYIPAMSDQSIIVKNTGSIFLAGPPLVKAATGEDVSVQDLGGAEVHTAISGVADHLAQNDEHALALLREIVAHLRPSAKPSPFKLQTPRPPHYDPSELYGVMPKDLQKFVDMREILARLLDESEFFEFKKNYGTTLICGFAHLGGIPVGVLANNGVLFSESALKGCHFIQLCCQENIPLLFIQNITGFMVGKKYEHGGIAKDGAKLVHAVANAQVPKITLVVGGSYGAGNYGMCGRAYDPNFLFMWPSATIAVMGAQQAAQVLVTVKRDQLAKSGKTLSPEAEQAISAPILEKYRRESHAYYSSARLWDDGVITLGNTRQVLHMAFASTLHHDWQKTRFGVFRM